MQSVIFCHRLRNTLKRCNHSVSFLYSSTRTVSKYTVRDDDANRTRYVMGDVLCRIPCYLPLSGNKIQGKRHRTDPNQRHQGSVSLRTSCFHRSVQFRRVRKCDRFRASLQKVETMICIFSLRTYMFIFNRYMGRGESDETKVAELKAQLNAKLDVYETILSKQPYLGGQVSEKYLSVPFHSLPHSYERFSRWPTYFICRMVDGSFRSAKVTYSIQGHTSRNGGTRYHHDRHGKRSRPWLEKRNTRDIFVHVLSLTNRWVFFPFVFWMVESSAARLTLSMGYRKHHAHMWWDKCQAHVCDHNTRRQLDSLSIT